MISFWSCAISSSATSVHGPVKIISLLDVGPGAQVLFKVAVSLQNKYIYP